jgi:hypothetical protein
VLQEITPWLEVLDYYHPEQLNVASALSDIRQVVAAELVPDNGSADVPLGQMLRNLAKSDSYNFHARKGSDTMLVLFTWQ